MDDMRTPSGAPSEEARKEHATTPHGGYPIFDKESALAAIHLRGHAHDSSEREAIINHAAQYAPDAAAKAREVDKGE